MSQSGYISQGLQFYDAALNSSSFAAELAKKGIDEAELTAGRDAFRNLQTLAVTQQKERGGAQEATRKRDAAHDALAEKMYDFLRDGESGAPEAPTTARTAGAEGGVRPF